MISSDNTGTVSGTFSARNNVRSVRSQEHFLFQSRNMWFALQKVGVWPMGEGGE